MTVSIEQAQLKLASLIACASEGEPVSITQDGREVAQIVATAGKDRRPAPGFVRDVVEIISDEDDEHLKHLIGFGEEQPDLPLSEQQKQQLRDRLAKNVADPNQGESWEVVRHRIRQSVSRAK